MRGSKPGKAPGCPRRISVQRRASQSGRSWASCSASCLCTPEQWAPYTDRAVFRLHPRHCRLEVAGPVQPGLHLCPAARWPVGRMAQSVLGCGHRDRPVGRGGRHIGRGALPAARQRSGQGRRRRAAARKGSRCRLSRRTAAPGRYIGIVPPPVCRRSGHSRIARNCHCVARLSSSTSSARRPSGIAGSPGANLNLRATLVRATSGPFSKCSPLLSRHTWWNVSNPSARTPPGWNSCTPMNSNSRHRIVDRLARSRQLATTACPGHVGRPGVQCRASR